MLLAPGSEGSAHGAGVDSLILNGNLCLLLSSGKAAGGLARWRAPYDLRLRDTSVSHRSIGVKYWTVELRSMDCQAFEYSVARTCARHIIPYSSWHVLLLQLSARCDGGCFAQYLENSYRF